MAGKDNIFSDINDFVFGFGDSVFWNSTFSGSYSDTSRFKCQGDYCAMDSSISNFDIVVVNGSYALNHTEVRSIKTQLTALGTNSFSNSVLENNDVIFDNTNFSVCDKQIVCIVYRDIILSIICVVSLLFSVACIYLSQIVSLS